MNSNDSLISSDKENLVAQRLFQDYLGVSFDELVLFCFLEQSAKYLGMFYEQDPYELRDDKYLIN